MPLIKPPSVSVAAAAAVTTNFCQAATSAAATAAQQHHSDQQQQQSQAEQLQSYHNQNEFRAAQAAATTPLSAVAPTTVLKQAKSMPVTPVQAKSHFFSSSPECVYDVYDAYQAANVATGSRQHAYPNFSLHMSDDDDNDDEDFSSRYDNEEDCSSLAMITPPPPYDTPRAMRSAAGATSVPRKFVFNNRELFSMSTPAYCSAGIGNVGAGSGGGAGALVGSGLSAITPTKLSAAAAAMFAAAPPMAQLNRKWKRRRRRNSSSGDSKELDKLVLQSVDWDENDIY